MASAHGAGIVTGLDTGGDGGRERPAQKPSMVITLRKSPQFDELMAAAQARQQSEGRHGFFGGREGDDGDGSNDDEPPQIPARRILGEGGGPGASQGDAGGAGPCRGGGGAPGPSRA